MTGNSQETRIPLGGNYIYQATMHKYHETNSVNWTTICRNHKIVPMCNYAWTMEMGQIEHSKPLHGTTGYAPTYNPQVWRSAPGHDGEPITSVLQISTIGIWNFR